MAKVRIGFSRLSVPNQIERALNITGKMTGNAHFPTPRPTLDAVKTANNALEKLYNESRNKDRLKLKLMAGSRKALLKVINELAAYVENVSEGSEEIIRSSGFDVVGKRVFTNDTAGPVYNLRLSDGRVSGSLRGDWNEAANAVIYRVEVATDRAFTAIVKTKYTTKLHKEITGLKANISHWVRVTAIGREEEGSTCQGAELKVR